MINIYILYDLDIHMDYYYFNIFIAMIHAQFKNIKKKKTKNPLLRPSVRNINVRKKFTSLLSKENNCCH